MAACNAWEIWRIRHPVIDAVAIVNLTPLEGVLFHNGQPDERVSVYLRESDLLERLGTLDDEAMLRVIRAYFQIRNG